MVYLKQSLLIPLILLLSMTSVSSCAVPIELPEPVNQWYPGCTAPTFIDMSGLGWADHWGMTTIDNAQRNCYYRYHGCLVRLTRITELAFRALCRRSE